MNLRHEASFCREENIWANVIIIVKQPGPGQSSLERVSQGPVEVAICFRSHGNHNNSISAPGREDVQ